MELSVVDSGVGILQASFFMPVAVAVPVKGAVNSVAETYSGCAIPCMLFLKYSYFSLTFPYICVTMNFSNCSLYLNNHEK